MADRDILPGYFKPSNYTLSISQLDFKAWTYQGVVAIDGAILQSTSKLVVNALELQLQSATVSVSTGKGSLELTASDFEYDKVKQRCTLNFGAETLPVSARATLTIRFSGIINNEMAGFYRSKYKPPAGTTPAASVARDDEFYYMTSTQFEACDARRAFPCFDEPNLKATFSLSLEIPSDQVALSNMPVQSTTEGSQPGLTVVTFEPTPVMSTYLLAWAVGDFEYVEAFTERRYGGGKRLPVRVYTTRGLKEQGRWALEHAAKIVDYFSDVFGIEYPLPKADLLAVHEFTHGAMENWGLVTYRTTAVLFDEATSEARYKNRVAYVVAHELAHQWFGNLVTMDWWDELWLNEGFATWVGWLATDHLHPDWHVWAQFVDEGMENAFKLDGVRASHAIHVPVADALDVNQIFDHISYLKGCAVIRMLASHLGVPTFLKGVSAYLKAHAYGNAKTADLWAALSEASGADVAALMDAWISKMGFPVLRVSEDAAKGTVHVSQGRFLSTGDVTAADDQTLWWVPLAVRGLKTAPSAAAVTNLVMDSRDATVENVPLAAAGKDDDFYVINGAATGFYRVAYPSDRLAKLGRQLDRLTIEERISIQGGALALSYSGDASTTDLFEFLRGFADKEEDATVWCSVLGTLASVRSLFADDAEIKEGLRRFTLRLVERQVTKIGWQEGKDEDYLTGQLRKRLLTTAVVNNHEDTVKTALSHFESYFSDTGSTTSKIHPNLRLPIFRAGIRHLSPRAVTLLLDEYARAPAIDTRELVLQVLGHAPDTSTLTQTTLPFLFNSGPDCVAPGDMHTLAASIAAHSAEARDILWSELRARWAELVAQAEGSTVAGKLANPVVLDRFVKTVLSRHCETATLAEIDEFFGPGGGGHGEVRAFARTLDAVREQIRSRARYRESQREVVREWLRKEGFLEGWEKDKQEDGSVDGE